MNDRAISRVKTSAVQAALKAGAVLRKHFGGPFDVREKKGAGLVTEIDIAAEKAAMGTVCWK